MLMNKDPPGSERRVFDYSAGQENVSESIGNEEVMYTGNGTAYRSATDHSLIGKWMAGIPPSLLTVSTALYSGASSICL